MAAAATAPKMCNVLASLDQPTLQLIIEALPIAQDLHAADNLRFAQRRQELLGLYGDDAAPNLLSPALLPCANSARDERLVDESFAHALIDTMASAQAAQLPTGAAGAPALHENAVRAHRRRLRESLELPVHDSRSELG